MDWNAQGKGIAYMAFYFTGHRCVEKFMTEFRIDTIKRGTAMPYLVAPPPLGQCPPSLSSVL
jgi:hypothetical protein